MCGSALSCRVVALGRSGGCPYSAYSGGHPLRFCSRAVPRPCLPGEDAVVEIDKIFWETKQS
jgi:hypothetical protein